MIIPFDWIVSYQCQCRGDQAPVVCSRVHHCRKQNHPRDQTGCPDPPTETQPRQRMSTEIENKIRDWDQPSF